MSMIKSDTVFLFIVAVVFSVLAIAAFLPLLSLADSLLNAGCTGWDCV